MNDNDILRQLLAFHLGTVTDEEARHIKDRIQNDREYRTMSESVKTGLEGDTIPIPDRLNALGRDIWENRETRFSPIPFPIKKRHPLALVAAAALLFTAGAFFLLLESRQTRFGVTTRGDILVKGDPGTTPKPGFTLTAGKTGEARISLPKSGTISFSGPGTLTLAKADPDKRIQTWHLSRGRAAVSLAPKSFDSFTMTTPHLALRVTGTRFALNVTPGETRLTVDEGQVVVSKPGLPDATLGPGQTTEGGKPGLPSSTQQHKKALRERITLNDGSTLTGHILSQTRDILTVQTAAGILRIPRTDVKSVRIEQ